MTEEQALQAASPTDANEIEKLLQEAEVSQAELTQAAVGQPEISQTPPSQKPEPPVAPLPPEPADGQQQVEPQAPEVKDEDDVEKELEQYKVPDNAHRNTKETVKALKEAIRKKSVRTRELQEQLNKESEDKKAVKVLTPEIEQQLAELQKTRDELTKTLRIKDSEGSVKQQYAPLIQQLETESLQLLKNWGTKEEVTKFIEDQGGVDEIMFSPRLMPDGRTTQEEWFRTNILEAMNPRQKFEFDSRLRQLADKKSEQSRAIESAKQDSDRFQTEQQQLFESNRKQWMDRFNKKKSEVMKHIGPSAEKLEVPLKATPEEKARIEEHNKWLVESENFANNAVNAREPEQIAQITVMAGAANYMSHVIEQQNAKLIELANQIKERDDKLAAITKARSTARPSSAPPAQSTPVNRPKLESDSEAIEKLLQEHENKQ